MNWEAEAERIAEEIIADAHSIKLLAYKLIPYKNRRITEVAEALQLIELTGKVPDYLRAVRNARSQGEVEICGDCAGLHPVDCDCWENRAIYSEHINCRCSGCLT